MCKTETIICDECGSAFLQARSRMEKLCPECAHILYDYPKCDHVFEGGKCIYCYWDGKQSEYIKSRNP